MIAVGLFGSLMRLIYTFKSNVFKTLIKIYMMIEEASYWNL